jgi:hypothetical protein
MNTLSMYQFLRVEIPTIRPPDEFLKVTQLLLCELLERVLKVLASEHSKGSAGLGASAELMMIRESYNRGGESSE